MAETITNNASDVSCAGPRTPLILVFGDSCDWCDWCDCEVSGVQTEQVLHHRHVIDSHGQEVCALNRFRLQDRTLRLVSWVAETKCVLVANLAGESYAGVLWFAILDMIQTFAGRRFSHCNMAAFLHTNTCWFCACRSIFQHSPTKSWNMHLRSKCFLALVWNLVEVHLFVGFLMWSAACRYSTCIRCQGLVPRQKQKLFTEGVQEKARESLSWSLLLNVWDMCGLLWLILGYFGD